MQKSTKVMILIDTGYLPDMYQLCVRTAVNLLCSNLDTSSRYRKPMRLQIQKSTQKVYFQKQKRKWGIILVQYTFLMVISNAAFGNWTLQLPRIP